MEKKIPVSQLRVGMHLLRIEGSWIDHPFWRTRFLIDDPRTLGQVLRLIALNFLPGVEAFSANITGHINLR